MIFVWFTCSYFNVCSANSCTTFQSYIKFCGIRLCSRV